MFNSAIEEIRAMYSVLDTGLGWQFLYTPTSTLSCPNGVMFVGTNPGGSELAENCSSKKGNAYLVESWPDNGAALQEQFVELFKLLHRMRIIPGDSAEKAINQTLTTNFCPLRSPTWKLLPRRNKAIQLSRKFWQRLLPQIKPHLLLCMGRVPYDELNRVLSNIAQRSESEQKWDTGWGKTAFRAHKHFLSNYNSTVVYIPHLSRFKIMSREKYVTNTTKFATKLKQYAA